MVISAVKYAHRKLWTLVIVALFSVSSILIITRVALVSIHVYKQELQALISSLVESSVHIGHVQTGWYWYQPQIYLENIRLKSQHTGDTIVDIGQVRLDLQLFSSLIHREFRFEKIVLHDFRLSLTEPSPADARSRPLMHNKQDYLRVLSWLQRQGEIIMTQGSIELIHQSHRFNFTDVFLQYSKYRDQQQRLQLQMYLEDTERSFLTFDGVVSGKLDDKKSINGQFHSLVKSANLKPLLEKFIPNLPIEETGNSTLNLWGSVKEGYVPHLQSRIQASEFTPHIYGKPVKFGKSSSDISIELLNNEWTLKVHDFDSQLELPDTQLSVNYQNQGDSELWYLTFPKITLNSIKSDAVMNIIKALDFNRKIEQTIELIESGELSNIVIGFKSQNMQRLVNSIQFNVKNLVYNKHGQMPGISHVDAYVESNLKQGVIYTSSPTPGFLNLSPLFREQLPIEINKGTVYWDFSPQSFNVYWLGVSAITSGSRLKSEGVLSFLPNTIRPALQQISQLKGVKSHSGETLSLYYPADIMKTKLLSWLDNAFSEVNIPNTVAITHGELTTFPFMNNEGVFQVYSDIASLNLFYHKDWPPVHDIRAKLLFDANSMELNAPSARILEQPIQGLTARIERLNHPRLLLNGELDELDADYGKLFIERSPLKHSVGNVLNNFNIRGSMPLSLALDLPIQRLSAHKVKGALMLKNIFFSIPKYDLEFPNLSGIFRFTDKGIFAKGLKTNVFSRPATVDIDSSPTANSFDSTIKVKSSFNRQSLSKSFKADWLKLVSGTSAYNATVKIPDQSDKPISITAYTPLKGTEISLPPPYYKSSNSSMPLKINALVKSNETLVKAFYSDILSTKLNLSKGKIHSGVLSLGRVSNTDELLRDNNFIIHGDAPFVNIDSWYKFYEHYLASPADDKLSINLDLTSENIYYKTFSVKNSRLGIQALPNSTLILLDGDNLSQGKLKIPSTQLKNNNEPLLFSAKMLKISGNEENSSPISNFKAWPNLKVDVEKLLLDDIDLGRVRLNLEPTLHKLNITLAEISAPWLSGKFTGQWFTAKGKSSSSFNGKLNADKLEDVLKRFNIPTKLSANDVSLYFDATWPDSPMNFSKGTLSGDFTLKLDKGLIKDVEPGFGRLISLFNFSPSALKRRLTLDVSDVLGKGFRFDKVRARMSLSNQILKTCDVQVKSSAGEVSICGQADLKNKVYDNVKVDVTSNLDATSLSLVGVASGGPAVGAAVWLIQKLITKKVGDMVHVQYLVNGPWKQPKIQEVIDGRAVDIPE